MNNNTFLQPFNASWHIIERCNYDCKFCFRPDHGKDLSLDEAKLVIDKLIEAGLKKISWAGGEPLLWKGIIELIEYTKSKGIITMLITNGRLLTEDRLERLEKCLDWLNLPLEGSTSEMNDKMTRSVGHFDQTLRLMEWANGTKNVKLKINTVAARQNKDDIVNMIPLIKKFDVKRWKIFQFYPVRRIAKMNKAIFTMQESEFLRIKEEVVPQFRKDECMVVFETNADMDRSYFAIAPDSEVYISYNYDDYFIGNLLKEDPEKIFCNPVLDKIKYWERSKWFISEDESSELSSSATETSSGRKRSLPKIKVLI